MVSWSRSEGRMTALSVIIRRRSRGYSSTQLKVGCWDYVIVHISFLFFPVHNLRILLFSFCNDTDIQTSTENNLTVPVYLHAIFNKSI